MSEESKPPSVHSSIRLRAIPGHGRTPLLAFENALCWLAPTGVHRFIQRQWIAKGDPSMPLPAWQGIMRPQPSGIIALAYRGIVSVSEPELSPYTISASVCPVVEGLSSRLMVAAAALPLSIDVCLSVVLSVSTCFCMWGLSHPMLLQRIS